MSNISFTILFFTCIATVSFGQIELSDTLKAEILSNPKVVGVEYIYERYFSGKIRQEGWSYLSEYISLSDSTKANIDTTKFDAALFHRVGVWFRYDKRGRVVRIDSIPFNDVSEIVETYYDKRGSKIKIIRYFEDLNPDTIAYNNYNKNTDFVKNYHGTWFYKNSTQIEYEYNVCGSKYACGIYKSYYSNGQLHWYCNFDNDGKKEGECIEYYNDGKIKSKGVYSKDKKIGVWHYYTSSGDLEKTEEFSVH